MMTTASLVFALVVMTAAQSYPSPPSCIPCATCAPVEAHTPSDTACYRLGQTIPNSFFLNNPNIQFVATTSEKGVGWTSFALYTVMGILAMVLYAWEALNREAKKKAMSSGVTSANSASTRGGGSRGGRSGDSDVYVNPFLFSAAGFCIMRMISISVNLATPKLLPNMAVGFIFESFGNILFLLTFTLVGLLWCNMIIRADIYKEHFMRLKVALWILWGWVAIMLFIAMVCFESYLPINFGGAAHDGFLLYPNNLTFVVILPINNVLTKPQAAVITSSDGIHMSYMVEKGTYSCYGFMLGALFAVLAAIIIAKMSASHAQTSKMAGEQSERSKKFRRTVFAILFVAIPVALTFVVIFTFAILEVKTHRHANRTEQYITQNLCSECVALAVLLIHYWRARLRSYIKERRDSLASSAALSGSKGASSAGDSGLSAGASGTSSRGDEEEGEKKPKKDNIDADFEGQVISL